MPKRQYPIARVKVQAPGRLYQTKYEGFAQNDLLADLWRQNRLRCSAVDFGQLGIPPPGGAGLRVPSAMLLDRAGLNCVLCRPFLDTSQSIGLGHFTAYGGAWTQLPNHGLQGEMQLFQYTGRANEITGVISNFTLPTNPIFALSLYRAGPPPDFDWNLCSPSTEIHFGIGESDEWVLALPYGAPMYLMRRVGGEWWKAPESERSVHVPSLEGYASGQRLILWIAILRGKLVVSTDGFASDVWVYESPEGPITARAGKVSLWHNAGQWLFSFFPFTMTTAILDGPPLETGYQTQASSGEVFTHYRYLAARDDRGRELSTVNVVDNTANRADLSPTQRAWQAAIMPYVWQQGNVGVDPDTGEPVGFRTCVSPQLYSVSTGQYPQVVELPPPEERDLSAEVKRLEGDHAEKLATVSYELELDNQHGQQAELAEYQRVTVELGRQDEEGEEEYEAALDGYLVEPAAEARSGGASTVRVTALDGMTRLRDEKADGRAPVFDYWLVKDVFHWVLDRCGLPRSRQDLEDTGLRLSQGEPEKPLWLPEPGRTWLEFLQEVARFDHGAAVFFEAEGNFTKGCPHCRGLRTAENVLRHDGTMTGACENAVSWRLYTRPEAAPDPAEPGEIVALARPRRSLSERDYVNYVAVCGVDQAGRPLRSTVYDPASLYDASSDRFVGWRKMEVAALRHYTTEAEVNRLAQEMLAERSRRPEYLSLLTPLEPGMRIGQVLEVCGGEQVGAGGQLYRIVGLRHRLERRPRRLALTWVKAKWMGEVSEE